MTRTIRKLFASAVLGGTFLAPSAFAEPMPAAAAVPAEQKMTPRQLHEHLAKGSGWVRMKTENGGTNNGTAWILDKDRKLMITNAHVVEGRDAVRVLFPVWKDGKLVREEAAYAAVDGVGAVVIDRDETRDLALLLVDSVPADSHAFKVVGEPEEGDAVRTIGGFTLGGEGLVWGAVRGEVRTVGPVKGWKGDGKVRKVSTDAPINGGNSGGPLVNEAGEVVGVNASYQTNARSVSHHISTEELTGFMKVADKLVRPATAADYLLRGSRRLDYSRNDLAIQDFTAAIKKDAALADAFHLRGKAFLANKDAATALEDFTAALKLDADNYQYHVSRGNAHLAMGKWAEAKADFGAAVRIDPSKPLGYNERGIAAYRAADYDAAIADFTRAHEKAPRNALYLSNRADSYEKQDKYALAAADWTAALELAPNHAPYAVSAGWAFAKAEQFDACVKAFRTAAKIDPSARHASLVAIGLRLGGDHKTALSTVNEALAKFAAEPNANPNHVYIARYNRGLIHAALGNPQSAVEDFTKGIELTGGKNHYPYLGRARAYHALGNAEASAADTAAAKKLGWKPAAADVTVVGTWKGSFDMQGARFTQVITLKADGTFAATTTMVGPTGTQSISDTGTYKFANGTMTIDGKTTGSVVRKITDLAADSLNVEVQEAGVVVKMARQK